MEFEVVFNGLPPGLHEITAEQLAERIGAVVDGDGSWKITGPAELGAGGENKIGFLEKSDDAPSPESSNTGALVVPMQGDFPGPKVLLRANDPRRAFGRLLLLFVPDPVEEPGVHSAAFVEEGVSLGKGAHVGPFAVVRAGAKIGDGATIGALCYVGRQAVIGEQARLFPGVVVYHRCRIGRRTRLHSGTVIGADGFGYFYRDGEGHLKFPQVGGVEIGDDVEIGANSCVDRGTIAPTSVGDGVKLDNLVQVAHNCKIGDDTVISGHVGLAGTVSTGRGVVLGGMVGVKDHVHIGDGAKVAGGSKVYGGLEPGKTYGGHPARPFGEWMRIQAIAKKLPQMNRKLKELEAEIEQLGKRLQDNSPSD